MIPVEQRYRLVSSRDVAAPTRKDLDLGPSQTLTLCRLEGAGRVVRFWFTLPLFRQRNALKDLVLCVYWDGEDTPSIEVPVGDFFGASFGRPRPLTSGSLLVVGGAYTCLLPMPFNEGAVFQLRNDSTRALRTIFFQIAYYEEPGRLEREATLHAQFRRDQCAVSRTPFEALAAVGSGRFVGLRVELQTRAWWLKPPLSAIALPRGFGLGILEGAETITVDGLATTGTGTEDYFSGGFYFLGAPFCTRSFGCTQRSFLTGRVAAYRFHDDDPIPFSRSIRVTLDHGLDNSMAADYVSVAYWYQPEPHAPFPELPPSRARRPRVPWTNPVQWFLVAGVGSLLVLAAAYACMSLWR